MKSALKAAGICWAIAILSVFIPLAHFVLVPGFLIGGIFVFFWKKKQKFSLLAATGSCPHCQTNFQLGAQPLKFPIETYCDSCRKAFRLRPVDDKALASLEHLEN